MKKDELSKTSSIILLVSAFFICISFIISAVSLVRANQKIKIRSLNEIITENGNVKEGEKTYLIIKSISQKFAKSRDNGYYFASDGDYNYIVYLTKDKAKDLFSKDLENNPEKVYGVSKSITDDVKKISLEKYNLGNDKEITMNDYFSYFGDKYLDQVNVN